MNNNLEYLNKLFGLEGKTAVIIGGTGVLCGAMAEGLAGAGAEVVLVGRDEEKAVARLKNIHQFQDKAYFERADVTQKEEVKELLTRVIKKSGKVDILVNGAGTTAPTPFVDIQEDELENILNINLKSIIFTSQIFGSYMIENKITGSMINIGSMSGLIPLSRVFTYSATKAAVHNISKNLAREWAPHNIRVNTLVPGFFPTDLNRKYLVGERLENIMRHTPMSRFGEASELIGATILMASDQAGSFITGSEFVVDGGFSSMTI